MLQYLIIKKNKYIHYRYPYSPQFKKKKKKLGGGWRGGGAGPSSVLGTKVRRSLGTGPFTGPVKEGKKHWEVLWRISLKLGMSIYIG